MLRFGGDDGKDEALPIDLGGAEETKPLDWRGRVYYHPAYRGIRLCYDQAQQNGPSTVSTLTPVAGIHGDWKRAEPRPRRSCLRAPRP